MVQLFQSPRAVVCRVPVGWLRMPRSARGAGSPPHHTAACATRAGSASGSGLPPALVVDDAGPARRRARRGPTLRLRSLSAGGRYRLPRRAHRERLCPSTSFVRTGRVLGLSAAPSSSRKLYAGQRTGLARADPTACRGSCSAAPRYSERALLVCAPSSTVLPPRRCLTLRSSRRMGSASPFPGTWCVPSTRMSEGTLCYAARPGAAGATCTCFVLSPHFGALDRPRAFRLSSVSVLHAPRPPQLSCTGDHVATRCHDDRRE
jgi:hypothetical protein